MAQRSAAHCRQRKLRLEGRTLRAFRASRSPTLSYHGLVYAEHFGRAAYIARCRSVYLRTGGAVLSPLSAFLLLQGIETVALRVERHVENAERLPSFCAAIPGSSGSSMLDFPTAPTMLWRKSIWPAAPARSCPSASREAMRAAVRFHDALKLVTRLVNLGDAKSLVCHPASTTHRQMSAEEQRNAGVLPEMIRLSVGIEHIDDIVEDFDQALAASA
jgi:O-acetylhomoserine (thiol)-lyase